MAEYEFKKHSKKDEIISLFMIAFAVFIGIIVWVPAVKTGFLGLLFYQIAFGLIGTSALALPIVLLFIAIDRLLTKTYNVTRTRKNCLLFILLSTVILISVLNLDTEKLYLLTKTTKGNSAFKSIGIFWNAGLKPELISDSTLWSGGLVGGLFGYSLRIVAGKTGSVIILIAMILALLVVVFNISYTHYLQKSAAAIQQTRIRLEEKRKQRQEQKELALSEAAENTDAEADSTEFTDEKNGEKEQPENVEQEFGFDLSQQYLENNPHDVSTEWLRKELAKEQNIPYEESFKVRFDLPEGTWEKSEASEASPVDYGLNFRDENYSARQETTSWETANLPQEEVPSDTQTDLQSSARFAVENKEQSSASKNSDPITQSTASNSEQSIRNIKLRSSGSTDGTDSEITVSPAAAHIQEADIEILEEQGRAHWEDRSDAQVGVDFNRRPVRPKQISLTDTYIPPDYDLLNQQPDLKQDEETIIEIKNLGARLEQTLNNFGVDAKVVNYTTGPTITRFELSPGPGVKVSKITNLADDIALSLAAIGVRIEAPIPGKSAIGIEIPNKETHPVFLSGIIQSQAFKKNDSILTAGIGRDIQGNEILCDLGKMPHLLIAGATGSGKSVCINSIIISLLYRSGPSDLRMIMIDPKVVELNVYNGIPHLLQPVVTNPKKAYGALNWAITEMESRYEKFADNSVRDFSSYNQLIKSGQIEGEKLPAILIIIDELSDLMATTPTEVEDAIARLTAMARAAGIHLIIATQRPSVDVITGVIKANIPSRIAFTVASQVDSRTILDMGGAEKLLGKGDMLYYPQSASKPIRGQGAFVTDAEVERVIRYLKDFYETDYDESVAKAIENTTGKTNNGSAGTMGHDEEEDELLEDALRLVVESEYASISLIQRKLSVGYPRAARIVDRLCELGFVGPPEGSKPRKVLLTMEEYLNLQNDAGKNNLEGDS